MAITIIPNGYGLLIFKWLTSGTTRRMSARMGYKLNNAAVPITANAALAIYSTRFLAQMHNTMTLTGVRSYWRDGAGVLHVEDSSTAAAAGTGANAPLPPNCAQLLRKNTGVVGASQRGRMYLHPLGESSVDQAGVISAGSLTDAQTRATGLLSDLNAAAPVDNCVLLHSGAGTPTVITSLVVDSIIATQRLRMRG